jgi:hypothetical protein
MSGADSPQGRGTPAGDPKPTPDDYADDIENGAPLPPITVPAWMAAQQRWMLACDEGPVGPLSFVTDRPHDPDQWVTLASIDAIMAAEAAGRVTRTPWLGRLFALGADRRGNGEIVVGLLCIGCIDADGKVADWAMSLLATMNSYAEITADGGIQCIARIQLNELPDTRRRLGIADDDPTQSRTRSFANSEHAATAQLFIGATASPSPATIGNRRPTTWASCMLDGCAHSVYCSHLP